MAQLNKEQEVKLLKQLADGNGYFAQSFSKDIDVMISNIANDFELTNGITLENQVYDLIEASKEQKKMLTSEIVKAVEDEKKKRIELVEFIITQSYYSDNEKLYEKAVSEIGIDIVVKFKYRKGFVLNGAEMDYLISKI